MSEKVELIYICMTLFIFLSLSINIGILFGLISYDFKNEKIQNNLSNASKWLCGFGTFMFIIFLLFSLGTGLIFMLQD